MRIKRSLRPGLSEETLREITAFVALLLLSLSLFGWSSLGWWSSDSQTEDMFAPRPAPPSLIVYTSDPESRVAADIGFFRDGSSTKGWLDLKFQNVNDPENFRWALVGTGDMVFYFDQELLLGEQSPIPPKDFIALTSSCTTGAKSAEAQSVVFGGLESSLEVATGFRRDVTLDEYVGSLVFPRIGPEVVGDQYSYRLGAIGRPTEANRRSLADFSLAIFDECVDMIGLGEGVTGQLTATPAEWTIGLSPHKSEDRTLVSAPTENSTGPRAWRITGLQEITEVTFQNAGLVRSHQAALFAAGILGGIGGSIASTWFTAAPRATRGERAPSPRSERP